MPEKQLVESSWKSFAKGKTYKDDALLKALQALAKAERGRPEDHAEALEALDKQIDLLRKANKGDKELLGQLDDMSSAVVRQRKVADAALKQAAKDAQAAEDDEEEDSPALLTTKMVPLVRTLRKGELRMRATVCTAGAATAVLITRKTVSPATRKVMTEYLDVKGAAKFIPAEVLYEKNALTFVVEGSGGGLAKRIQKALLAQLELRLKVRVRGADGVEEEGEDLDEADAGRDSDDTKGAKEADKPTGDAGVAQAKAALMQRLGKFKPAMETALKGQHPEAAKLRALSGYVSEKAAAGDFAGALKALDMAEKLLGLPTAAAAPAPAAAPAVGRPGVDPAKAFNERLAALLPKLKTAPPEVKAKAAEAGNLAKKGDFTAAQAALDALEAALEGKAPSGTAASKPEAKPEAKPAAQTADPRQVEFDGLVARMTPAYNTLSSATKSPELSANFQKFDMAWQMALDSAEGGNLDRALQVLRKLDESKVLTTLLKEAQASEPQGEPGRKGGTGRLVAYRTALLAYRDVVGAVNRQIDALKSAIPEVVPDERDLADALAAELTERSESFLDVVDQAINAAKNERAPILEGLGQMLDGYLNEVLSNPLIKHVDNNPFGVNVSIETSLSKALQAIRKAIPA